MLNRESMPPYHSLNDSPASAHKRIVGTGIMADRVRSFDWAATPLGPIKNWSETLTAAVNQVICTPQPATLSWGDDLVFFYNDATIPTLSHRHPAALGRSYRDVFAEAWHLVGEDIEACFVRGKTVIREDMLIPLLRNGVVEEHYWTYSLIPIHKDEEIVGVYNPYQNTTASVLTARERDHANAQINQFLSATTDAVVGVNRQWIITYLNQSAQKTYGPDRELVGKHLWEEFPDAVYEGSPFVEHYNRAMYEGLSGSFEAHYPDPLNIWIQLEVYPTDEGLVTFSRDVTEKKQIAAALIQNEKLAAVGRLASSIAHEINNPLESVTNLLYLARTSAEPGPVLEYLDSAERELRRVSAISNQTLRFNKQSTAPSVVSCTDLFSEALSIYQGRLLNSQVQVEKRKRAKRPTQCFEGEIRQVLSNFISNAIDAMKTGGGRLILRSREATNWRTGQKGLALTVADTGIGMSSNDQKRVFDAFYTTKGIGGTGLGLWISKEIVDRHQGAINLRSSQEPGRSGTVFSLFLPFQIAPRR
jgi:signal transduction histidine kinase